MMKAQPARRAFVAILFGLLVGGVQSTSFWFLNKCSYPVWVGTLSGAGTPPLAQTGFLLTPGSTAALPAPPAWSGRFWARTDCSTDPSGRFSCATGDCATGKVACDGSGAVPPATLVEITLGTGGANDFYDVSLVDGYNLPVSVAPAGGTGPCRAASCPQDVNAVCPEALRVVGAGGGAVVACKSACGAFGDPRDCCTGAFGSPASCGPTSYSEMFKSACPLAYSYAYDDATSTFTCAGAAGYGLTFCP